MPDMIEQKKDNEKAVLELMIRMYCTGKRHIKKEGQRLCDSCQTLKEYAWQRIDACPLMETKRFCSLCKVQCYDPNRREQIRKVMRYAGPRMLWHHPILTLRYFVLTKLNSK